MEYYNGVTGGAKVALQWATPGAPGYATLPGNYFTPAYGNQTSVKAPSGRTTFHHYALPWTHQSDYQLVVNGTTPGTAVPMITSYDYDAYGRLVDKYEPKGNAAVSLNGSSGNLTGTQDANYESTWTYYAAGATNAIAACAPNPSVNQGEGLATYTRPGIAPITYVYDAAGRIVKQTQNAVDTCSSYDADGRLTQVATPDESDTYTYDPDGNKRTATKTPLIQGTPTSLATEYDESGAIRATSTNSGNPPSTTNSYDADGNQAQALVHTSYNPTTTTTTYAYDAADEKTGECNTSDCYTFVYDGSAALKVTIYPNHTFVWNVFNASGKITHEYIRHCPTTLCNFATGVGAAVPSDISGPIDYTYVYDVDGRQTTKQRYAVTATPQTATSTYAYDAVGRLSTTTDLSGTQAAYTYDLNSNRLTDAETPSGGSTTTTTYTYDRTVTPGLDQLTKTQVGAGTPTCYRYTPEGNESKYGDNATCDNTLTLVWDNRNRVKTGSWLKADNPPFINHLATLFWTYDALGRLVRECTASCLGSDLGYAGTDDQLLLHDGVLMKDADGVGTLDTQTSSQVGTSYIHTYRYYDTHGDLATDSTVSGPGPSNTYGAFGTIPPAPGGFYGLNYAWLAGSDRFIEKGINLYPMGARMYDPAIGRFISPDPIDGGSANPYDYANQDPINGTDPDGTGVAIGGTRLGAGVGIAAFFAALVGGSGGGCKGCDQVISKIIHDRIDRPAHVPAPPEGNMPGGGFIWKGGRDGQWHNPDTGESWSDDRLHPDGVDPHWDYGNGREKWRVFPDGTAQRRR